MRILQRFKFVTVLSACILAAATTRTQAITLPVTPVTYYADGGDHVTGFFNVNLSNVPNGFSVSNGVYVGFCTSIYDASPTGLFHTALLFDSTSPNLPAIVPSEAWDLINYVLNHPIGTADEVQAAIWILDNGISILPVTPNVLQMVADAEANGHGFVPSNGQLVAVIVRATDDTAVQTIIIPVPTSTNPCLQLIKTADEPVIPLGQAASYSYVVTNCGGVTLTNVIVVDDAGTPNDLSDDFTVGTIPVLLPGQSETLHATTMLPTSLCVSSNSDTSAGSLTVEVLPSGDIKVVFRQSRNLNDNVYGTPAPADGWNKHKFDDLVGSDEADFVFTDSKGKVVMNFQLDYLSKSSAYPSGYGSLGVTGGDGKMIVGSASNVLSFTTTLTDDLNQSPAFYGFTVNSPSPESAFPTWDYVDGYTVVVSKNAFGSAGFGGVSIGYVHNSPSKNGTDKITPVSCNACVTNTAFAGTNFNGMLFIMATDTATVCTGTPSGCTLGSCTPPYPFNSSNQLTSIDFNESEILRKAVLQSTSNCIPQNLQLFYNDERALCLGISQVTVKTKTTTTVSSYNVTPLPSDPGSAFNPSVGSTILSGDQSGTDPSGRPIFPSLFVTDLTQNPLNPLAGDWQFGGTPIPPDALFGTWKSATKTVDYTKPAPQAPPAPPAPPKPPGPPAPPKPPGPVITSPTITLTVASDPAKNNWNLGPGADPVPAGLKNEGFGCEARWDLTKLGLISGHTYRFYFMVHDGDQNKDGGDVGQGCAVLTMP